MSLKRALNLLALCIVLFNTQSANAFNQKALNVNDVINVDAIKNGQRHPVRVWLEKGVYELTAMNPQNGGKFLARNAWEGESLHCDNEGMTCVRGWQWAVVIHSKAGDLVPVNQKLANGDRVLWMPAIPKVTDDIGQWFAPRASASMAFEFRPQKLRFKLLETGFVNFFDPDSMTEDNVGGVSFRLNLINLKSDMDGDLFDDDEDAFPNNSFAAIDTDSDGYPDRWNLAGTSKTNTLVLDNFPLDPSKH